MGALQLGLARLQAALAPAPQRLLAQLHERLPALAAVRYERLSESIHSATAWLRQRPASTEEAVERLSFLVELQVIPAAWQCCIASPTTVYLDLETLHSVSTHCLPRCLCLLDRWAEHREIGPMPANTWM